MSQLFNIFNISGATLTAQSQRLNATASNIANANNISATEADAYKAKHPVFKEILNGDKAGGVRVAALAESQRPVEKIYNPGHPLANEEGYVFGTNVSPVEEMANMISAQRSYQQNVEVVNVTKSMLMRTIQMGQ